MTSASRRRRRNRDAKPADGRQLTYSEVLRLPLCLSYKYAQGRALIYVMF